MTVGYLTDAELDAAFKRTFLPLQDTMFAIQGEHWSRVRKTYGKGGDEVYGAIQNTFGGGVGSSSEGTLPQANMEAYLQPNFTWNRVYGVLDVDGLLLDASRTSEQAFVKFISRATVTKMKSFNRYLGGNVLFGDGTGILGQFSGNASGTAAAPILTIINTSASTYGYRKGYFEKGDDVNINTLTSLFRITAVDHDNNQITLSRLTGSDDLTAIGAGTHSVYMQGSRNNDPYGFLGIIENNTHYGVAEEYRYAPTLVDSGGSPLEEAMLIELVEKFKEDTDEYPNELVLPPHHYRAFLKLQTDKDWISRPAAKSDRGDQKYIANVSYNGIRLQYGDGSTMVTQSKFVRPSDVLCYSSKYVDWYGVGDKTGWKNPVDGQTFLRLEGKDNYRAFLRAYGELFINPFYVGAVTGLPTT